MAELPLYRTSLRPRQASTKRWKEYYLLVILFVGFIVLFAGVLWFVPNVEEDLNYKKAYQTFTKELPIPPTGRLPSVLPAPRAKPHFAEFAPPNNNNINNDKDRAEVEDVMNPRRKLESERNLIDDIGAVPLEQQRRRETEGRAVVFEKEKEEAGLLEEEEEEEELERRNDVLQTNREEAEDREEEGGMDEEDPVVVERRNKVVEVCCWWRGVFCGRCVFGCHSVLSMPVYYTCTVSHEVKSVHISLM